MGLFSLRNLRQYLEAKLGPVFNLWRTINMHTKRNRKHADLCERADAAPVLQSNSSDPESILKPGEFDVH